MKTLSVWQKTKTFFPLFQSMVEKEKLESVAIIGAADGKFVIPLALKGINVMAIEIDKIAVNGGEVEFSDNICGKIEGLRSRLEIEGVTDRVKVVEGDFLQLDNLATFDAVFTSCSWHYSKNIGQTNLFIRKMCSLVKVSGIFCAEFMLAFAPEHYKLERYFVEGQIKKYFAQGKWEHREEFYTPVFDEEPHVGNIHPHQHRMGFFMAKNKNT
jgi:hypothetical protein